MEPLKALSSPIFGEWYLALSTESKGGKGIRRDAAAAVFPGTLYFCSFPFFTPGHRGYRSCEIYPDDHREYKWKDVAAVIRDT